MNLRTLARTVARSVAGIGCAAVLLLGIAGAHASELVMFTREGCVYCQRWDRDVAAHYDKTDEARMLPLRRVDIGDQATSGIALVSAVRFTPTFVVVDQGREVGRITGYFSDDMFWGLLDQLAAKIPQLDAKRS